MPNYGFNNHCSQELLLDDDIEDDDDDGSYNGEVTRTTHADESEPQCCGNRSEEILHIRELNGMICRPSPVKETCKVVRKEDENGNKMVNEYVRECKIGAGSYGKVVIFVTDSCFSPYFLLEMFLHSFCVDMCNRCCIEAL